MYSKGRRQPSVMKHNFGQVPRADIPRSTFNLSHGWKTTFDADVLITCGVWDVIPGDSWNVRSTVLARLATPLRPLMDNLYIDVFYFFTPYRILWDNFEKFMGAQDDPGDSISFTIPTVSDTVTSRTNLGTPWDYFGLPPTVEATSVPSSAMPFRAMNLIWNDWFRDENLQDSLPTLTTDGPQALSSTFGLSLLKRCKKHDYFTSALPWPQKGATGVSIPLGTQAPISGLGVDQSATFPDSGFSVKDTADGDTTYDNSDDFVTTGVVRMRGIGAGDTALDVYADLSAATSATINQLRLAFQTQKLLERDARSGTRYVETLKAHWGVTFPDYTAQRPVYLGGGTIPVGISPVPQTSNSPSTPTDKDKQGGLTGFGEAIGSAGFTKSFVEHGVIICILNARGDITYSQGQDRYWAKSTRYDFYYPVLSGIGEQSILNKEIWITGTGTPATDDLVFGYTGRYNEYRFQNSHLTALMRPDAIGTLASWNLSEDFATLPALGSTFIESNTGVPLDRAIAVPAEPHFIADIYHDIKAARPLPLYGVPGAGLNF